MGLVAMLTPYLLVIVSTTPVAETQYKIGRPNQMAAHGALTACLAWFPAIRLKGSSSDTSKTKLVYCWSNILTVLEVTEIPPDPADPEKPPTLAFKPRNRWAANESIVAVQWISRSVLSVLTITQQLLILEDEGLRVTDSFDLVNKQIYHIDSFSPQLRSLVETLDEEDQSMHGVVADAYYMSFRSYKGRLFLLGVNDISVGSLSNWADRLFALMEANQFVAAIRLAKDYYVGSSEKLTVGLPKNNEARHDLVRDKLLEIMSASVRYVFGKSGGRSPAQVEEHKLMDLADACITACIVLNDRDFLFDDLYEYYEENESAGTFMDALEPYIMEGDIQSLPPSAIKALVAHFSETHTAEHLEEVLCLLDTSTMDIDQVTSLCKSYNLYDAFIYVWTQALKDYVGPLIELISLIDQDANLTDAESVRNFKIAMKMFPYMSYTLTGRMYPTGDELGAADAMRAKTDIYRYLFTGNSRQGRFGNLRSILLFDSASFMSMLNEAFEDSFLNETADQVGSANGPSDKFSINRQYIISILLEVMDTGSEFDILSTIYLDMFIARNIPKYPQYILLPGSALNGILLRLCKYPLEDMLEDCQLSAECLLSIYHPPDMQVFIPAFKTARFYRILKSVYRAEGQYSELIMTYFDDPEEKEMVFTTLRNCLRKHSALTPKQHQEVLDVMTAHAAELVTMNVTEAAYLIQEVAPDLHLRFVESLDHDQRGQYLYLKVLLEPLERKNRAQRALGQTLVETYVKLMCTYDPQNVAEFIDTLSETRNNLALNIDSVLSVMEGQGVIDAAVVLLARRGELRRAMDRLIEHLQTLKIGLTEIMDVPIEAHDEGKKLIKSIEKYGRVGIWLCQRFNDSRKLSEKPLAVTEKKIMSMRDRAVALREPLNFDESLWLDLIETLVHIARSLAVNCRSEGWHSKLTGGTLEGSPKGQGNDVPISPLRNLVQQVFTALLGLTSERSASTNRTDLTFLRILRAFLTRAASTSPSLNELRSVLRDIFSAYTYEESLLSLANSMLGKDLFVDVDELTKLRSRGWRPKGRLCYICPQRVWGPGAGEQIWDAWESKTKKPPKRTATAGTSTSVGEAFHVSPGARDIKGKGRAVDSAFLPAGDAGTCEAETSLPSTEDMTAARVDPPDLDQNLRKSSHNHHNSALIIFACRHGDNFTVFNGHDPSGGYVEYLDAETAYNEGMLGIENNAIYLGVDHKSIVKDGPGRRSVRLQSRGVYASGLIVADIGHMPEDVCGTWPAFWMTGAKWPDDGELDIIEGVNVQDQLESALHLGPGCKVDKNQDMIGTMQTEDCYVFSPDQPGNQGCVVDASHGVGYGSAFNKAGGAVLATEITKDAVSIWYFPRSKIPAELENGVTNVDTAKWGKPMSRFSGDCDFEEKIKDQTIIFNTAFCGDWAKNRWQENGCAAKAPTCEEFVKNHPEAFKDVYWSINWMKVFQQGGGSSGGNPVESAAPTVKQSQHSEKTQTSVRTVTPTRQTTLALQGTSTTPVASVPAHTALSSSQSQYGCITYVTKWTITTVITTGAADKQAAPTLNA
ncbi:hypothetical protein KEM56_007692 [Ascosphaera pollenicola]|nr:hypothetical protein KEM56_007692 [Ascosphaera pollenicola]